MRNYLLLPFKSHPSMRESSKRLHKQSNLRFNDNNIYNKKCKKSKCPTMSPWNSSVRFFMIPRRSPIQIQSKKSKATSVTQRFRRNPIQTKFLSIYRRIINKLWRMAFTPRMMVINLWMPNKELAS